jgi:hypothetical protein
LGLGNRYAGYLSTQVSGSVHVNYRHFLSSPRFRPEFGGLPS